MSKELNVWTVIRESGRANTYEKDTTLSGLLNNIYSEYQTAGSVWDRPDILYYNGKIIVPKGLSNIAWAYGKEFIRLRGLYLESVHELASRMVSGKSTEMVQ